MLNYDQIKSFFIITLCTCFELLEKKVTKVSVIDPLNEQHIIIKESHQTAQNII